jgi:predicted MPP superfamily phosphohydrolase
MKTLRFLFTILAICFLAACTKDLPTDDLSQIPANGNNALKSKPAQLKIAVMSDIHYMDPSLLIADGAAFQTYLAYDPKLLQFSDPIFRTALSKIKLEKPDIVLIPGDLTKDGEKVSHEATAALLQQLSDNGVKVFVIPGNHDINNPEAASYNGDNATPVPTITASDFTDIYSNFGYENAKSRDANSLSYICEPYSNLWILGIDDCKYDKNVTTAIVSGEIKEETMGWIEEKLQYARENNITVLSMMHHGIVEHYIGEQQLDYGYVTDNYLTDGPRLLAKGLKVMFTGHYHANDIAMLGSESGDVLFDIETGSLVTPPSPFRIVTLSDNGMDINTKRITSVNCTIPLGFSFTRYSDQFLITHLDVYFAAYLNGIYGVPEDVAAYIAPQFRNAMMAHYAGDEKIKPKDQAADNWIGTNVSPILGGALQSLWYDLPPADNQLKISSK